MIKAYVWMGSIAASLEKLGPCLGTDLDEGAQADFIQSVSLRKPTASELIRNADSNLQKLEIMGNAALGPWENAPWIQHLSPAGPMPA